MCKIVWNGTVPSIHLSLDAVHASCSVGLDVFLVSLHSEDHFKSSSVEKQSVLLVH